MRRSGNKDNLALACVRVSLCPLQAGAMARLLENALAGSAITVTLLFFGMNMRVVDAIRRKRSVGSVQFFPFVATLLKYGPSADAPPG